MPLALPEHYDLPLEAVCTLAEEFGLPAAAVQRLPDVGLTNAIYALGEDLVLRVPRQGERFSRCLKQEAAVVPLVIAAGVRAPRLVRHDETRSLLPAPYAISERARGTRLEAARDPHR